MTKLKIEYEMLSSICIWYGYWEDYKLNNDGKLKFQTPKPGCTTLFVVYR